MYIYIYIYIYIYMQTNALFTIWIAIFVKHDLLTEHLTPFWFAMLVNDNGPAFWFQKDRKMKNFDMFII